MTTARAVRTLCFVPPPRLRTVSQALSLRSTISRAPSYLLCRVEAAGIEPASADAPERASTSLSCDSISPAGRLQATYRRASHPLEVPLRAIGSPSAASPLLAPDSVPRAEDGATSLPNLG